MEHNENLFKRIFSWTNIGLVFVVVVTLFFISQLLESWKPEESSIPQLTSEDEDFFAEEIDQEIDEMGTEAQKVDEALLQPLMEKKFVIQVGSFQDKKRADVFGEELKKKGYAPIVETKDLGDKGVWYRVYVGAFEAKDQAQTLLDKVKKDYSGSFIKQL